jgi:hypothetical protein
MNAVFKKLDFVSRMPKTKILITESIILDSLVLIFLNQMNLKNLKY